MRNSLILGLLLLVIALLLGPYLSGGQVEQWHIQQFNHANSSSNMAGLPAGWRVQGSQLSRGWFSSDLNLQLQPPDGLCSTPPCALISVDNRVYHGPVALGALPAKTGLIPSLAVAVTELDLKQLLPQLQEISLPKARIETRIGFSGKSRSQLRVAPAELTLRNGSRWVHDGISGEWVDGSQTLSLQATNASYNTASGAMLAFNDTRYEQGLDQYNLSLDGITLSQSTDGKAGAAALSLHGLKLQLNSKVQASEDEQPALLFARLEAELESLRRGPLGSGPMQLALQLDRLAVENLVNIRDSMTTIYSRGMPAQLQHLALQGLLLRELPALSQTTPEIRLDKLEMALGEERIDGNLQLRLIPNQEPKRNLFEVIKIVDLAASVALPRAIVQAAAAQQAIKAQPPITAAELLKQWLDKGWFIASGQRYHSKLSLADQRLLVNGNESEPWARWLELQRIHQLHKKGLDGHGNWQRYLNTPPSNPAGDSQ